MNAADIRHKSGKGELGRDGVYRAFKTIPQARILHSWTLKEMLNKLGASGLQSELSHPVGLLSHTLQVMEAA